MTLVDAPRRAAIQQQQQAAAGPAPAPATGHMLGVDVSNYTSELTPQALAAWKADGVGLVIIQVFPSYPPYVEKYAQQQQQMAQCRAAGFVVEAYIYDYLDSPDWRNGCLDGLKDSGVTRVWADEEDIRPFNNTPAAVAKTLAAIEAAGFTTGIYTGAWWWSGSKKKDGTWTGGHMGDTTIFQKFPLWDANYDNVADVSEGFVPYGGWTSCVMKQYFGSTSLHGVSGVDLDVT